MPFYLRSNKGKRSIIIKIIIVIVVTIIIATELPLYAGPSCKLLTCIAL